LRLAGSLVNGRGVWGGSFVLMLGQFALFGLLGAAVARAGVRSFLRPAVQLPCLWMAASVVGPVAFDVLRHTATSEVERYALPGLPGALLVFACALHHVPGRFAGVVLAATLIAWLPGIRDVPRAAPRWWQPFPVFARELAGLTGPRDLVIVNSIPSGVLGIARYVDPATPMASWVVQLGERRMPEDATALIQDRCRVAFVRVHDVGARAPLESWLRERADVEREYHDALMGTDVVRFTRAGRDPRCAAAAPAGVH
jgi:hypothetical protein